ncbi:MAG: DUF1571 domain-containing protein [Acidobacteriia bacterium]|nr:DUF1571 domain-containing protein [Terriglobia bacterium]
MSFVLAAMAARVAASDSSSPEQWLTEAEAAYGNVTSYTAIFHKQQRVAGKLLPEETILIKYKKPFSLYMRWVRAPYKGSELLYVEGWNGNRIRAHRGGIMRFLTRNLDPRDPALMVDNLRPVTSTGIGFLLETVAINIRKAIDASELMFSEGAEEMVYGRKTKVFDVVFPKQSAKDYDGYRFVINQDAETKLLIRIRTYDWAVQLVENYAYESLDLGARLKDADFDPKNPEYHF